MADNDHALELRGISRRFGAVVANDEVDFRARSGSIHALVGENGAGKSTLMRVAFGLVKPDAGTVSIGGQTVPPSYSPQVAMKKRVGMVHQHFMLVENMTVAENIILGREPTEVGLLAPHAVAGEICKIASDLGVAVDPDKLIEDHSVGEKQRVEILKALWRGCDVLILDEPTAVLTPAEVLAFFASLRKLAAAGMAIVIITHKLDEVFDVADEITVMRRGKAVAHCDVASSSPEAIAEMMVGRQVLLRVEKGPATPKDVVLSINGASVRRARGDRALSDVTLSIRQGEILGIAGVEGNGQSELAAVIAGLVPLESGSIELDGRELSSASVGFRRDAGIALVPEDRHESGLVLDFSVAENLVLGRTNEFATRVGLDLRALEAFAAREIQAHDIRPADPDARAGGLSGGNQQKVVIARELGRESISLLVACQPTRGVDIGAIERIHEQLVEARDNGLAVLLISAELGELRSLSDRLLVLFRGRIVAELDADEIAADDAPSRIGALMTGAAEVKEEE